MRLAPHLLEGRHGERIACRYLMRLGFDILARRFRGAGGEIDLVAFDHQTLVFIEVKTRSSRAFGDPWEFVDWEKQQRFRATAEEFIARYDLGQYTYRFDIVSVVAPERRAREISHFPNAF
jgi:putative endonuclease